MSTANVAPPSPSEDLAMRSSLEPSLLRDSLPPAPKRRAFSVSDRGIYRGASSSASAARRAVSTAFSNVSRFVKSSPTNTTTTTTRASTTSADATVASSGNSMTDDPALPPPRSRAHSYGAAISSSWKISSKLPQVPATLKALRRPRQLSLRRRGSSSSSTASSSALQPWSQGHVQYVASTFSYHGEDAGAVSSYYHIVADGISAPFAGQAPECVPQDRVSSSVIAQALVQAVEEALEKLTNRNSEPIDASCFEQTICDAIHTARLQCMEHRESRIATTLCVVYFDWWNSKLRCFTLGDSKCVVVRKGSFVFESTCTVREFNVPCVVNLSHALEPNDYLVESFDIVQGDTCLTFSDGIGDNVYKGDLLDAMDTLDNGGQWTLQQMSDALVAHSRPSSSGSTVDGGGVGTAATTATSTAKPEQEDGEEQHQPQPQEGEDDAHEPTEVNHSEDGADGAGAASSGSRVEPEEEVAITTDNAVVVAIESETTTPVSLLGDRLHSTSMDDDDNTQADKLSVDATTATITTTNTTMSTEPPPRKREFYPFATAAAYEYRRRVLRQRAVAPPELLNDKNFQRHLRDSALLLDLHDGKNVMDRQVLISKANRRPHYSLLQLHRMAQIRAKKPDDVTLFVSRFA